MYRKKNNSHLSFRDAFLRQIHLPDNVCAFKRNPDCSTLTHYRTITGVCNNLQRPYEGSAQTAFGRLLPAAYDDGISFNYIEKISQVFSVGFFI